MTTTETGPVATDRSPGATPARPRVPLISKQLVLYTLIGGCGVVLDFFLFLLLYRVAGLHGQLASVLSISAAILTSFTLNTLFNFRRRDRLFGRFARFYAVGAGGIVLTSVLLAVFAGQLGIDPVIVKVCALPLVLLYQYSLNTRWSFA